MFSHHQYYPISEDAYLHQLQHRKAAIEAEERAILQRQQQQAYLRRIEQQEEQERQLRLAQAEAEYRRRLHEAQQIKRFQKHEILCSHAQPQPEPRVRQRYHAPQPAAVRSAPQCIRFAKQSQAPAPRQSSEGNALDFVIKSLLGHNQQAAPAREPQLRVSPRRRVAQPSPTLAPVERQKPPSAPTAVDFMTELFQAFSEMNEPATAHNSDSPLPRSPRTLKQSAFKVASSTKAFQASTPPAAPKAEEDLNLMDILSMFLGPQTEQAPRSSASASSSGASTSAAAATAPLRPSTFSAPTLVTPSRIPSQTQAPSAAEVSPSANVSQPPKAEQGLNLLDLLNMFLHPQTEQASHGPAVASGSGSSGSGSPTPAVAISTSKSPSPSSSLSAAPTPLPAPTLPIAELSLKEQLEKRLNNEHESEIRDTIQAIFESLSASLPSHRQERPSTTSQSDVKGKGKETSPVAAATEEVEQEEPTSADIMRSLSSIASIETIFRSLSSEFAFPSQLDFTPPSSPSSTSIDLDPTTPAASGLAYTSRNAPVRYYTHALSGLLTQLDEISSFGNEEVRRRRKEVVDAVEKEIEGAEWEIEGRKKVWERTKEGVVAPLQVAEGAEITHDDVAVPAVEATSIVQASVSTEAANSEAPRHSIQETHPGVSDVTENLQGYDMSDLPEEPIVAEEVAAVVRPVVAEEAEEIAESTSRNDLAAEDASKTEAVEDPLVESIVDMSATVTPSTTTTPAYGTLSPPDLDVALPSLPLTDEQLSAAPSDSAEETPKSTLLSRPPAKISSSASPSLPDAPTAPSPPSSALTDTPLVPSFLASAFPAGEKEEEHLMRSLSQRNSNPSKDDLEDELDAVVVLSLSKSQERDNESGSEWSEVEA